MKRLLLPLFTFALGAAAAHAAIDWTPGTNLAQGAVVVVSSNPGDARAITDNNNGSSWQAWASSHGTTADWALIDLGAQITFTDIEIMWEASHSRRYSVYVSDTPIPYAESTDAPTACRIIDPDWLAGAVPATTGGDNSEGNYTENLSFDSPQTGRYMLIYNNEYNNFGSNYGIRIFELRVANIQGRDAVDALRLEQTGRAVAGDGAVSIVVTPVNKLGNAMDAGLIGDIRLTCNSADVAVTAVGNGKFSVSAAAHGSYTLTASATVIADGRKLTASHLLNVDMNWNNLTNAATGCQIVGRVKAEAEVLHPAALAVDGDPATYYEYNGEWGGGDSWLLVDLGADYMIEAVGARYVDLGVPGRCVFGYAKDATDILDKIAADGTDYIWPEVTAGAAWTYSPQLVRSTDGVTTYIYPRPVEARYLLMRDADNPGGKPCVADFLVKGTEIVNSVPTDIQITFGRGGIMTDETNTVTAVVVDQYGKAVDGAVPKITVSGADYSNGTVTPTGAGLVAVTASYGQLSASRSFAVASAADYCLSGAVIESSAGTQADTRAVTDGGADITAPGAAFQLAANEPAGAHEHWLTVELAKPYDLDMIVCLWEGACPSDYDVYLGTSSTDMRLYYSERNKKGMQSHSDRFSGQEMKDIKYITVITTGNATDYGLKLFDLKAYGTSQSKATATGMRLSVSDDYIVTGKTVTLTGTVVDQFGLDMSELPVEYSCTHPDATITDGRFTAAATGQYTVTATSGPLSSSSTINVVANADDRLSAPELFYHTMLMDHYEPTNIFNGQEVQLTKVPAQVSVHFKYALSMDLLQLNWEAAAPSDYTVTARYVDGSEGTVLSVSGRGFEAGVNPSDKVMNIPGDNRGTTLVANANLRNVKQISINVTGKDHPYNIRLFGIEAYGHAGQPVTGIENVSCDAPDTAVYNLQGMKVGTVADKATLPPGLYIINGRKEVVGN